MYRHRPVGWCGCGHARVIVSLMAMGHQRHCVVVMFPSSLSSAQSRTRCLRVFLVARRGRRGSFAMPSSSSCGRRDLPVTCRVEAWAHGTRITVVVPSDRAGAAARFVVIVVCPPSSLPLPCQVMWVWVRLRTRRHRAVAGSASEPFGLLTAQEGMEVAGGRW